MMRDGSDAFGFVDRSPSILDKPMRVHTGFDGTPITDELFKTGDEFAEQR